MLSDRIERIGHSPTMRISALAGKLRAEGVDVLDFSAGQPDFPTPDSVKGAGKRAIDENRTRYTANEGVVELREAIAVKLRQDNRLEYSPDEILVSPGAKASLYFALMTLLNSGDEVLIPRPYWVSYPEQARLAGATPVFVPTDQDGFRLTADSLSSAITPRSRVLVLNYPSNPTGACYTREDLDAIARVCVERGLWVVADEIYEKLIYDGLEFASIASLGPEIKSRSVVINGMSKAYSMTGWRIGYAAGPPGVIAGMSKLQSHSTSNAASMGQWASVEALRDTDAEVEYRRQEFQRRRDVMLAGLETIPGITCDRPRGAFYAFPNVSGCFRRSDGDRAIRSGEDFARFLLERARVAVVPGEGFGAAEHVRLSYAASLERVQEGVDRIRQAVGTLT